MILVTGGAGYIGSHTVKVLKAAGFEPLIFDNFSTGHRSFVKDTPAVEGNICNAGDLARAHLDALDYLRAGGESAVLNCGYGHGYSVREVLASVQRVAGKALPIREVPRRAGDPDVLVARADRIRKLLGWQPALDDLDSIVASSLAWERRLLADPW